MPNANRYRGITTEARTTRCVPIRIESIVDLRSDPNNIMRGADYGEIVPPQESRDEFMNWYFARRRLDSISSRDVQDAEAIWRFVSGESDDLVERDERNQHWLRYTNAMARRKGNAVAAVVIVCS